MKVGEDYWGSKEELFFDSLIVAAATPAYWAGRWVMQRHVPEDLDVIFEQIRADLGDVNDPPDLPVHKFQTLIPGTLEPFDTTARRFRKFAGDELGQIEDIRKGRMAATGPRPILKQHQAERRRIIRLLELEGAPHTHPGISESWDYILTNRRKGWMSRYAIYQHTHAGLPHEVAINAALDEEDAAKASMKDSAVIFGEFVRMALTRRLK